MPCCFMNIIKKKMRILICFLLALLSIAGCGKITPAQGSSTASPTASSTKSRGYFTTLKGNNKDTFTIMIYVNGGIAESSYGLATEMLNKMMSAKIGENITVVLEMGGTDAWKNSSIPSETGGRLLLNSQGIFELKGGPSNTDIGSSAKLTDFIDSSKQEFPASRYALIFWGDIPMDMADIKTAVSGKGLDFIGFDTGAMDEAEAAYMLQNGADYLIAHTGAYAATGWNYATLLDTLSKNSSLSTPDIATILSEGMSSDEFYFYTGTVPGIYCADLTEVSNFFARVGDFLTGARNQIVGGNFHKIAKARWSCGRGERVDIRDITSALDFMESDALTKAYNSMMAYTSSAETGLSIYFPVGGAGDIEKKLEYYSAQGIDYKDFVSSYMSVALGGQAYAAGGDFAVAAAAQATAYPWYDSTLATEYNKLYYAPHRYDASGMSLSWKNDHYAFTLNDGDENKLASLSLRTYIDTGSSYVLLNDGAVTERDTDLDAMARATDEWMTINGQTVSYSTYTMGNTQYFLIPSYLNGAAASLVVVKDETTPEGRVTGAVLPEGPYSMFCTIASGDVISFRFDFYSYDNLPVGENEFGVKIAVADSLRVAAESVSEGDVLLCCAATDIYGSIYFSNMVNIREAAIING